jgi:hypothetical protein
MTRIRYPGFGDPLKAFESLAPLVDQLRAMQMKCRPFGPDYLALAITLEAMQTTAFHFTRRPHFYSAEDRGQAAERPAPAAPVPPTIP